ncbi:MAG: 50S ribosomal protein L6 [Flavobacteriales bacterium]|jgi:large subunit ribosomal protein L6|nr:50S ribosomal protein L6 [Flavobacteriales bacterium]NCG30297.1 50S ribosomal protein L6 [Bacteroidota bacterium]MBT3964482.1 50S ribosomal protein L6 [Flavobacteriales bacterium]MBT4704898.1 50S ribosomal protein L6 [Flavobacteriales bacterium]MBT4929673.1 50S ribosomal protein L6 [Flavobacteriales bacterium]
MSRIGNAPVEIPEGVEARMEGQTLIVKGPKGELTQDVDSCITVSIADGIITFDRENDHKDQRSMHGLYRSLASNMVEGVSKGYTTKQELVGVGYRAAVQGQKLDLALGFSHNILFEIPAEVKVKTEQERGKNPIVTLESHDKQLIGQVAAKIRSLRKPEPYKGKGIRFVGEHIRRKAGKSAAK